MRGQFPAATGIVHECHVETKKRYLMRARQISRQIRRAFFQALLHQLYIIWPVVSGVVVLMVGPGLLIGYIEGWRLGDALYFTFVTGLTIGYGDLTPKHGLSRCLAMVIGFAGIMLTGLVAAVTVRALDLAARDPD
jgi:hypothetical protein